MTRYDDMTKDELLAEARRRGVTPANQAMTKAELADALEDADEAGEASSDEDAEVDPRYVAMSSGDHLGVPLINPQPGVQNAYDRLGRSVGIGEIDYLGRNLTP